jgi:histidyl-tRNA synthetase
MNKIAAPRGTADVYPPDSARWQALEARTGSIARRFGYGEIRTPLFEATELFVRGVGETTDIVEKEMYTFTDKGGRSMTLRPEWTAPVVRALLEHNLLTQGPQRLYYLGPFFRYERPQAGRYRQANQFGVECFGFAGPEADVEVISLADDVLRSYALPGVVLHLNSIGDETCRPRYREALHSHFAAHADTLSADSRNRLERNPLRILDSKAPEDRALVASAPTVLDSLCADCAAHFAQVRALLEASGIAYEVDPRIVRGLDYYTRTVFEFVSSDIGTQATVCGGGRYDGLVASLGGPATPAVGFGMGLERLLMVLEKAGLAPPEERRGIAVIALGDAARAASVPLIAALRRVCDLPVTSDYAGAKLANQLKRADRANARGALILGDDEIRDGTVVARDLLLRSQESLAMADGVANGVARICAWYAGLAASAHVSEAV